MSLSKPVIEHPGTDAPTDLTIEDIVVGEGAEAKPGDTVEVHLPPDPLELAHSEHPPERTLRAAILEVERHVPTHLRLELLGAPLPGQTETGQTETRQDDTDQTEEVSR